MFIFGALYVILIPCRMSGFQEPRHLWQWVIYGIDTSWQHCKPFNLKNSQKKDFLPNPNYVSDQNTHEETFPSEINNAGKIDYLLFGTLFHSVEISKIFYQSDFTWNQFLRMWRFKNATFVIPGALNFSLGYAKIQSL